MFSPGILSFSNVQYLLSIQTQGENTISQGHKLGFWDSRNSKIAIFFEKIFYYLTIHCLNIEVEGG